jgi:hypothetical protein
MVAIVVIALFAFRPGGTLSLARDFSPWNDATSIHFVFRPVGTLRVARDFSPWIDASAFTHDCSLLIASMLAISSEQTSGAGDAQDQGLKSLATGAYLRDDGEQSVRDEEQDDLPPKKKRPVIKHLDGKRRAKVLSALAALIILGFALVLLAWMGARATKRYMRREPLLFQKPPEKTPHDEKDWTEKPLD